MKILLIQPAKPANAVGGEDFAVFEPLALEYLAAGVGGNHDVRIFDMRLDTDFYAALQEFVPDIVGVTAYTVHVNTAKGLLRDVKAHNPAIRTVVGGHHATVKPEDFCAPFIDVVVRGEGVYAFREIVARLEAERPLTDMPGAALIGEGNGTLVVSAEEGLIDLDAIPFPSRSLTAPYRRSYYSEWMKPLASIRTSKGCHFRCSFCALWKLTGGRYITRKPERIVEELGTIEEECVFFSDDESLLNAERMKRLAELIRQSGIRKRYFLYGRSDTIARHPGLLEQWKGVGLERVFVGLEFFRDADLKYIRKGSTVENNLKAVRILKGLGIEMFPNFIVRPDFDRREFRDFREFCLGLDLDFIGFTVLTPLPGTDFYDEVKDTLISSNYDHFDFFHTLLPTKLPLTDFYGELVTLYKGSRSLKNQVKLMRKYPLRELPSLFRLYGNFMARLKTMAGDYAA